MENPNTTQGQPQVGSDAGFVVDGPWSQLADVLEIRHAKTVDEVIDHARWLVESYKGMCDRLRVPVEKYKLGLGGEKLDMLVIEALDAALSTNVLAHTRAGAQDSAETTDSQNENEL